MFVYHLLKQYLLIMTKHLIIKLYLILMILTFFSINVFAQKSIEGIFESKPPSLGSFSIKFNKNFEYYSFSSSCLYRTIDSGLYELKGDTIIFHSKIKDEYYDSSYLKLDDFFDSIPKNEIIDTFYFSIVNRSNLKRKMSFHFSINNKTVVTFDSLPPDKLLDFKIPIHVKSEDITTQLYVNNKLITHQAINYLNIKIHYTKWIDYEPLADKMIYKKSKMYSVNAYQIFKKKFYIYKKQS